MTAPRPGAAQGALAYVQTVLAWARREAAFTEEATGLAAAAAEFATLHAYGAEIEWSWGEDHARIPLLDAQLAMRFLCPPSPRARIEAQLASRLRGRGVIDLYGDPLTFRLATHADGPVAIAGLARGVTPWREILRRVEAQSAVRYIELDRADAAVPDAVDWVRCTRLADWLDLLRRLPAWRRFKPILTCDVDSTPLPGGWSELLLDSDGRGTLERSRAVVRVLAAPGRRLPAGVAAPWEGAVFDNRRFWNDRYRINPELGSGLGSRGSVGRQKKACLARVMHEVAPDSILDVGCGDRVLWESVALPRGARYTGIDVAEEQIERLRRKWPDLGFVAGDFLAWAKTAPAADLVVCLDVLIHQHERAAYTAFVEHLWRCTGRCLLVAGFETQPTGEYAGAITAWHEPLSTTLARAGAPPGTALLRYRGTTLWQVRREDEQP